MAEWTDEQKANILRHYPSIEEYERISAQREAEEYLASTDYIVIKAYEYFMTGAELDQDYTEVFAKREEARNVLRELKESTDVEVPEEDVSEEVEVSEEISEDSENV